MPWAPWPLPSCGEETTLLTVSISGEAKICVEEIYSRLGSKDSRAVIEIRREAPHAACLQPSAPCSLAPIRSQSSQIKAPFYNKCIVMSLYDHHAMRPTRSVVWQRTHLPMKVWPLPSAPGKESLSPGLSASEGVFAWRLGAAPDIHKIMYGWGPASWLVILHV